jgi:excisionase family DNA binding protein
MGKADQDKPRQLMALVDVPKHRPCVTVRYLRRLVHERRIPFHKLDPERSGRVLIDLEDLDRFTEESRVEPT